MLMDRYFNRLKQNSHIDIYLSASGGAAGRITWPWKMNPPKESMPRMANSCEKYIIDSDPFDDNVTAEDVLSEAERLDAYAASLQDVYLDKEATVDSILKGLEVADSHTYDGKLLLPLQYPYTECYREIGEPENHIIGIGGMKDSTPTERIQQARKLRDNIGDEVCIHGFGWGVDGIANTIREEPGLIDSVDYSTPQHIAMSNVDESGEEMCTLLAMEIANILVKDLRKVTSYPKVTGTQKTIGGFK